MLAALVALLVIGQRVVGPLSMHIVSALLSSLVATAFWGCAQTRDGNKYWSGHSILPRGESIGSLNKTANNTTKDPATRARAIFTLFAHHIRPEFTATDVHRVLEDSTWLPEAEILGVRALAGSVPVQMSIEDTVFYLHLFRAQLNAEGCGWVIYFRLSGKRSDDDALAFLRGEAVAGSPRLMEFALCYPWRLSAESPRPRDPRGRKERFSDRGIHAYGQ